MKRGGSYLKKLIIVLLLVISTLFLMLERNVLAAELNVTISPVGGGSVTGTTATSINCPGTCGYSSAGPFSEDLFASPAPGYEFDHWEWTGGAGPGSSTANPVSFFVDYFYVYDVTALFRSVVVNRPPFISPEGNKTVNEGELLTFTVSATDPDGDQLTYFATGLPSGASFGNGTFSWQPDFAQAGTYQVMLWVQDGKGGSDNETIAITVLEANPNYSPILDPIGDKSVSGGELLTFTVSATDADGDPLTYSVSGLPAGASFVGQTFSWQPDLTQEGTYPVTFSVTDGQSSDSEQITVTVSGENHPPVLEPIGNKRVNTGELLTFGVSATDPDGDQLSCSASGLPEGASFNPGTRIFEWTPSSNQLGTHQVEFQASDGELMDSELVMIEVTLGLPELPDPFPYDQVSPSQGKAGVDPESICFLWPEATNADTYDFFLSRDRQFSSVDIAIEGLAEPLYCMGTAAASLTIGSLGKSHSPIGTSVAFRTEEGLDYCQSYFWRVIARNIHGEAAYPVFGFFTRMLEGTQLESPRPLENLEYQMISLPLAAEDPSPVAVLGDDLGPYNLSAWRLFRYESSDGKNHEYPDVPEMMPGLAYWLIAREGVRIDAQGSPVDTESDFIVQIPPGFFQLGSPFPFPVKWGDVKVRKGNVTVPVGGPGNEWLSPFLWKYEKGEYKTVEVLEPWEGYWIENMSVEAVELLIPPKMLIEQE